MVSDEHTRAAKEETYSDELVARWRAGARDEDAVDTTAVTVGMRSVLEESWCGSSGSCLPSAVRAGPGDNAEVRHKCGVDVARLNGGRGGVNGGDGSGGDEEDGGELHDDKNVGCVGDCGREGLREYARERRVTEEGAGGRKRGVRAA